MTHQFGESRESESAKIAFGGELPSFTRVDFGSYSTPAGGDITVALNRFNTINVIGIVTALWAIRLTIFVYAASFVRFCEQLTTLISHTVFLQENQADFRNAMLIANAKTFMQKAILNLPWAA